MPAWWGDRPVTPQTVAAIGRTFLSNWSMDKALNDLRRGGIDPGVVSPRRASNQWAVAPERSATGHALLLIDPHLSWWHPEAPALVGRDGASGPVGGGGGDALGLTTLRTMGYDEPNERAERWGNRGQTSTQIVELSRPIRSWIYLPVGQSDRPGSPRKPAR